MSSIAGASLKRPFVVLVGLQLSVLLVAMYIHVSSTLPSSYSWSRTVMLFWRSVSDEYFIVTAFFVLLSSFAANRSWLGPKEFELKSDLLPAVFTLLLFGTLLLVPSHYNVWDLLLSMPAAALFYMTMRRKRLFAVLAGLVSGTVALVVVSYAFTIIKSQLFVHALPLDHLVVAGEAALFGKPLYLRVAEWAAQNPPVVRFSDWIYYLFFHHMALIALYLFSVGDWVEQRRYVLSLTTCYLIGALSYHIFPAVGPAYYSPSHFSYLRQHAEYTVFIQDLLFKSTEGAKHGTLQFIETYAFIACMPSLHMAHESVMLYFSRSSIPMLVFSGVFWAASLVAVLVLGWHYLFDVIAGVVLAIFVVMIASKAGRV